MSQEVASSSYRTTTFVSSPLLIWMCLHLFSSTTTTSASFLGPSQLEQSTIVKSNTVRRQAFSNDEAEAFRQIFDEGLNASDYIINILEPKLYYEGQIIKPGEASAGVAAFNYQQAPTKDLARYGYASVKAFSLYQDKLSGRQNELTEVSLRETDFYRDCPLRADSIRCPDFSSHFRTADGTCNNEAHPEWGAAFWPFVRFLPPNYSDGVDKFRRSISGKPLPSPRKVSALIHRALDIVATRFTTMLMQWGQFLDHDVTSSAQSRGFNGSVPECCQPDGRGELSPDNRHPDCMPIIVDENDSFYNFHRLTCLNFVRSSPAPHKECALGPRDQINQITSFIDASNVYGSTRESRNSLRLFRGGKLKYKDLVTLKSLLPALDFPLQDECLSTSEQKHCFKGGDSRANEQPGLSSMHTVWLREHNRLVEQLAVLNPHWGDQRLFHEGRKIIGAQMQHITYNEYLPIILGERVTQVFELQLKRKGYFSGYNPNINPAAANVFSTAAFRFGHSLIPKNLNRCNRHHQLLPSRTLLRKEFMDPSAIHNVGAVDRLILGMCSQPCMQRDEFIVDELTNHLFEPPTKSFGMDLISLDLQRGRDHGIPTYIAWREACRLPQIRNWGQLLSIMDEDTVGRLRIAYGYLDDIDLFTGAMAEKPVIGGSVGPTFACIIGQQFTNLRHGDRFWYENGNFPSAFTSSQLNELRKVSLSRVICDNLDDIETIQKWVLLLPDEIENARVSCQDFSSIPKMNLNAWIEKAANSQDPFSSEGLSFKPTTETYFENTIEDENFDHRFQLPALGREDYITEIPRPIVHPSQSTPY